jgi:hypothetical protein
MDSNFHFGPAQSGEVTAYGARTPDASLATQRKALLEPSPSLSTLTLIRRRFIRLATTADGLHLRSGTLDPRRRKAGSSVFFAACSRHELGHVLLTVDSDARRAYASEMDERIATATSFISA